MRELNPDFLLQSRLSFGRGALYGWLLTGAALLVAFGFDGPSFETPTDVALMRAGLFLLLASLPYGAIQVRALERHGHLDARRLTGGSPVALALALVGGSAWVLLVCGIVVLLAAAFAGYDLQALTLSAVVALAVAMALLLLLIPPSTHVDSWMLLILLATGVFATVESVRAYQSVAIGVLIVCGITVPWALPMALRRMRGAVPTNAGPPVSLMRLVVRLRRTTHPELSKALLQAGQSISLAPLLAVAGPLSIWWLTVHRDAAGRDMFEILAVYGPLLLGGYEIAARVYDEHATGGLDRIRLSGRAKWHVVLELGTAYSLPFVAVSIVCAVALAALDRENAGGLLAPWPIAATILIFWPLLGAIRGGRPVLYVVTALGLAVTLGRFPRPAYALAALAAGTAIRASFPERTRSSTWLEIAGAASIAAILLYFMGATRVSSNRSVPAGLAWAVACFLSLSVGLVFAHGVRVPTRAIAYCAAAAAVAASIAEYIWVGGRLALDVQIHYLPSGNFAVPARGSQGTYAVVVGLYAAAGLVFGCWAMNRFLGRVFASFAARGIPLLVAVALLSVQNPYRMYELHDSLTLRYGYNSRAVLELLLLAALGIVACALWWRDAASVRAPPPPF